MEIPVRMHQTRTATETGESQSGLFCQAKTTSFAIAARPLIKIGEVKASIWPPRADACERRQLSPAGAVDPGGRVLRQSRRDTDARLTKW
jgi:hypothetical protein